MVRRLRVTPREEHAVAPATARDAAFALAIAVLVATAAERVVASAHGVATQPLSWSARAALLGLHALAVTAAAAAIAVVVVTARRGHPRTASAIAAVLLGIFGALVGHALAQGSWIARQWLAPVVAWSPAVVGILAGLAATRWTHGRRPTLVLAAIAIAAAIVDATIAVGHYPAFHLAA